MMETSGIIQARLYGKTIARTALDGYRGKPGSGKSVLSRRISGGLFRRLLYSNTPADARGRTIEPRPEPRLDSVKSRRCQCIGDDQGERNLDHMIESDVLPGGRQAGFECEAVGDMREKRGARDDNHVVPKVNSIGQRAGEHPKPDCRCEAGMPLRYLVRRSALDHKNGGRGDKRHDEIAVLEMPNQEQPIIGDVHQADAQKNHSNLCALFHLEWVKSQKDVDRIAAQESEDVFEMGEKSGAGREIDTADGRQEP